MFPKVVRPTKKGRKHRPGLCKEVFVGVGLLVSLIIVTLIHLLPNEYFMDHEVSQWDIEAVDELGCGWPFANQSSSYLPSEAVAPYGTRTLSFSVCNGFANQRVAILSAIAVALETQRALVLPNLLLDGTQYTADEINEYSSYSVPFAQFYDVDVFRGKLAKHGMSVYSQLPKSAEVTLLEMSKVAIDDLKLEYNEVTNIRLSCPAFRVPSFIMAKHRPVLEAVFAALKPAPHIDGLVSALDRDFRATSPTSAYNYLHLRVEKDFILHCKRWESIPDGITRDNCFNNTLAIGKQLEVHEFDKATPLVVTLSWAQADTAVLGKALASLRESGYRILTTPDRLKRYLVSDGAICRELNALIEYSLALKSKQFAGNSVSTFTAMLILERWMENKFATYYNGGNIPLEQVLPFYRLPWIFTANDHLAGSYFEMMKASVLSAKPANLRPYCLFSGSKSSVPYRWLRQAGVELIIHKPAWRSALLEEAQRHREENMVRSHLYASDDAIFGTWQRIDIPLLPQLAQFNYVLFTDCDAFFRRPLSLFDFGTPLPHALGMAGEVSDIFPFNAGIMLMNIPYLKQTYPDFLRWILLQKNGLNFGDYGPGDQGAYNQYYESEVRQAKLAQDFNAKPYHMYRESAYIVHFHGPKPSDYLEWVETGKCGLRDMCYHGMSQSLCEYILEFLQWNPTWHVALSLKEKCPAVHSSLSGFLKAIRQQE